MTGLMAVAGTEDVVELFNLPEDYQEFENEQGHRMPHGWYWWWLLEGEPNSYPTGPFPTMREAAMDVAMGGEQ